MSFRSSKTRGLKTRPSQRRLHTLGPVVEPLEGRAMLSVAGGPVLAYGTNGSAAAPPTGAANEYYVASASALQSNGDLVVVGSYNNVGFGTLATSFHSFSAERYTASGQIDPSFQTAPLMNAPGLSGNSGIDEFGFGQATGVAIQADGKIIVVGEVTNNVAKVVRLNSDGTLDTTFGTGGIVTLGTENLGDSLVDDATAVAILPGGAIAVAGTMYNTTNQGSPAVEVLNANGSVDTAYGTNGVSIAPLPTGAAAWLTVGDAIRQVVQPDGSIVIAGTAELPGGNVNNVEDVVTRFTASGVLDTTFGIGGQASLAPTTFFPTGTSFMGAALAMKSDGELIVGGGLFLSGQTAKSQMAVAELTSTGTLDTNFGYGGVNILPPPANSVAYVGSIAVQANGQIILADRFSTDLARLNSNGTLDITFGTDGIAYFNETTETLQTTAPTTSTAATLGDGSVGLAITSTGTILATNIGTPASDKSYFINGLLSKGATNDFDNDGITDRSIFITSAAVFGYTPSGGGTGPLIQFGIPGAGQSLPAPGAYGGEGIDEPAVYLPAHGEFAILNLQTNAVVLAPFGLTGPGASLPAPGDYDKSGATELAIYSPSSGAFVYRPADGGADVVFPIAPPGTTAIPVPGDYFGTGQDDIAVYVPSTATFLIRNPVSGQVVSIQDGIPNDSIAVPGDYDGSGRTELAVYIPSTAQFVYRPAGGGPDVVEQFGVAGVGTSLPAPGDYDGSGRTELGVYLTSTAVFAYRPASGAADVAEQLGVPGATTPFTLASGTDVPLTSSPDFSPSVSAEAVIPLTPDVLDSLAGPLAKKKADTDFPI